MKLNFGWSLELIAGPEPFQWYPRGLDLKKEDMGHVPKLIITRLFQEVKSQVPCTFHLFSGQRNVTIVLTSPVSPSLQARL